MTTTKKQKIAFQKTKLIGKQHNYNYENLL